MRHSTVSTDAFLLRASRLYLAVPGQRKKRTTAGTKSRRSHSGDGREASPPSFAHRTGKSWFPPTGSFFVPLTQNL
jgi:hypothetical protein